MQLKAGQRVAARLRLLRRLGEGGMGSVWSARHETLGIEVAVKLIGDAASRLSRRSLARFQLEATIAAKLNSPHVAHTYDHGVLPDGTPFIVMELLAGESLAQRLRRRPLSLRETSLIICQTAHALSRAHKMGIVHRDLKPSNMFLIDTDYELFLKLLDFGVAKRTGAGAAERLTQTGDIVGSPHYMSPEALTHEGPVDWRCDTWALAVVAYQCLTGARPFGGGSLIEVARSVMDIDYEPPTSLRPQLPARLDRWFARAFHSDIERRHQSVREMAESFAAIASGDDEGPESITTLPSLRSPAALALAASRDASPAIADQWSASRDIAPATEAIISERTTPDSLVAGVSAVARSMGPALSAPAPPIAPSKPRSGGQWLGEALSRLRLLAIGSSRAR